MKVDREQAMQLYRRGYTYAKIAEKLQCSEKQAGRIIRETRDSIDVFIHEMSARRMEDPCIRVLVNSGMTYLGISSLMGISREAVRQKIALF